MAKNRYFQRRVMPQFQPLSLQELTMVPGLKTQAHQQRQTMADSMQLNFNNFFGDEQEANQTRAEWSGKVQDYSDTLLKEGVNSGNLSKINQLAKDYGDLRRGKVNAMQTRYDQFTSKLKYLQDIKKDDPSKAWWVDQHINELYQENQNNPLNYDPQTGNYNSINDIQYADNIDFQNEVLDLMDHVRENVQTLGFGTSLGSDGSGVNTIPGTGHVYFTTQEGTRKWVDRNELMGVANAYLQKPEVQAYLAKLEKFTGQPSGMGKDNPWAKKEGDNLVIDTDTYIGNVIASSIEAKEYDNREYDYGIKTLKVDDGSGAGSSSFPLLDGVSVGHNIDPTANESYLQVYNNQIDELGIQKSQVLETRAGIQDNINSRLASQYGINSGFTDITDRYMKAQKDFLQYVQNNPKATEDQIKKNQSDIFQRYDLPSAMASDTQLRSHIDRYINVDAQYKGLDRRQAALRQNLDDTRATIQQAAPQAPQYEAKAQKNADKLYNYLAEGDNWKTFVAAGTNPTKQQFLQEARKQLNSMAGSIYDPSLVQKEISGDVDRRNVRNLWESNYAKGQYVDFSPIMRSDLGTAGQGLLGIGNAMTYGVASMFSDEAGETLDRIVNYQDALLMMKNLKTEVEDGVEYIANEAGDKLPKFDENQYLVGVVKPAGKAGVYYQNTMDQLTYLAEQNAGEKILVQGKNYTLRQHLSDQMDIDNDDIVGLTLDTPAFVVGGSRSNGINGISLTGTISYRNARGTITKSPIPSTVVDPNINPEFFNRVRTSLWMGMNAGGSIDPNAQGLINESVGKDMIESSGQNSVQDVQALLDDPAKTGTIKMYISNPQNPAQNLEVPLIKNEGEIGMYVGDQYKAFESFEAIQQWLGRYQYELLYGKQ